jgi:hypothetical protein
MPTGGMTSGMAGGGGSSYEGSDVSTGSQTPEGVTSPAAGGGGGADNGGQGSDNGNAGS